MADGQVGQPHYFKYGRKPTYKRSERYAEDPKIGQMLDNFEDVCYSLPATTSGRTAGLLFRVGNEKLKVGNSVARFKLQSLACGQIWRIFLLSRRNNLNGESNVDE